MEKIVPNKPFDVEKEIKETRKQFKRSRQIENIANIVLIILGVSSTIAIWTMFNQNMAKQAYEQGYYQGFDACIQENNLYERYNTYDEAETDAEIWNKYHDCNMYGLPEYAREYCEKAGSI